LKEFEMSAIGRISCVLACFALTIFVVQAARATGTITFYNRTDKPLKVNVAYSFFSGSFCHESDLDIKAGQSASLSREWGLDPKAYCPLGEIVFKSEGRMARLGTSSLPPSGPVGITITAVDSNLKVQLVKQT
jgi:hypothetical protein